MSRFNSDLLQFAEEGNIGECVRLLDAGLDINCRDMNRLTPLILALKAQKEATALLLIERGAQLDVVGVEAGLRYTTQPGTAWMGLWQLFISAEWM